ncbi:TRAP transporter substrate-binding protein DctP [Alkalihalobacillus deserti]|uniref:TRAP transporter substrate-binding protein DctP n=1 Tax=Alkalihalobacillus deserti TaxID=2879466 RepID=UPI001D1576A5|nr:TRAP transporter substrate-binding protein DctP [Alkalihalobacillus deserti]
MKKTITVGLLYIVFMLILNGCSAGATTESSNKGPENGGGGASEQTDVIHLTASTYTQPGIPVTVGFDTLLDEIEERSDGRVKFERFYNGSLTGAEDTIDAVQNRVADVAFIIPELQSGKVSLSTVATNPAIYENVWSVIKAFHTLYEEEPAVKEQWESHGVKKIGLYAAPQYHVLSTKDVSRFEDLKGLRTLTTGRSQALLAEGLGMIPVPMVQTQAYEAMSRGTIDSMLFNFSGGVAVGVDEVVNSIWTLPVSGLTSIIGMNLDVWESLPEDIQNIIEEVQQDFDAKMHHELFIKSDEKSAQTYAEQGVVIHETSEEDLNKIREAAAELVWDEWVKEQEDLGLPGQEVLDTFVELIEKYEQEIPY